MELLKNSENVNVLDFTDAEIAADWRKGMALDAAKLILEQGQAEGIRAGAWGVFHGHVEDSLAQHVYEGDQSTYVRGTGKCAIVSVQNIREENFERYEHDSFGSGTIHTDSGLTAVVTCEHGVTGKMKYETSVGDLIYEIARAQEAREV